MDITIPGSLDQTKPITYSSLTSQELESWYLDYITYHGRKQVLVADLERTVEADRLDDYQIELRIQHLAKSVNVAHELCAKCQNMLDHWPDLENSDYVLGRQFDTLELEAASRSGCKICDLLLWKLMTGGFRGSNGRLDLFRKIEGRLQVLGFDCHSSLFVQEVSDSLSDSSGTGRLVLRLPGMGNDGYGAVQLEVEVTDASFDFSEVKSLDMVKMWLRNCDSSHHICHNKMLYPRPTRLIRIGDGYIKLIRTDEMKEMPFYATLSYCWGLEPFTMLKAETYDAFMKAIPTSELPKTFRDAISIALDIGMSYIWIDALCIIQGDSTDWKREAGQMRHVYGGSYLNIAATNATSAHEGCFQGPNSYNRGVHVRVTTDRLSTGMRCFYIHADHNNVTTNSPLARRAWAFQEKLLSPRTLYCSPRGLFWQCRSQCMSEYHPTGVKPGIHSMFVCPEDTPWPWNMVVERYSDAALTHSSDRLPALAGIAMRQSEAREDQYLAGMWRKTLLEQILWSRRSSVPMGKRPLWQAPTWSWASIDGGVRVLDRVPARLRAHAMMPCVRIVDVWTTPSGPDPFGPVSGGELTLACAYLVPGKLDDDADDTCLVVLDVQELGIDRIATISINFRRDCLSDDEARNSRSVFLLPVYIQDTVASPSTCHAGDLVGSGAFALVLQRCCSSQNDNFRRIGWFELSGALSESNTPEENRQEIEGLLLRMILDSGPKVAEAECARVISEPEYHYSPYIITIE